MKAVFALAGKDLRDILRERSILASLLVQLFIAGFSTFLSVGLSGLYDPASVEAFPQADVGYVGPDDAFGDYLRRADNLRVVRVDAETARAAFDAGGLDAVVEENWESPELLRSVTVLLPEGTIEGTLLLTQLKSLLQDYEKDLRDDRSDRLTQTLVADPEAPGRGGQGFAFSYGVLLPLLLMTPVFLSGAIAGDSLVHEIQTRSLLLLRSAPLSGAGLVAAKLLVPVALAPAQVLLWIGLMTLNGLAVHNLALLLVLAALLATLLASLSIALAVLVRHEGQVQAAYALAVLLLAVASLLLPHDPLNLIALLASGSLPQTAWLTLAILAAIAAATLAAGSAFASRRIRRDQV